MLDYRAYPILYVDDDAANLVAARFALEDQFSIITARSASEAREILEQADQRVAILLTDQRMPGMTGAELCAEVGERHPDTVRMIVTAYADLHAVMGAISRGHASRYIAKPWRNTDLEEILRTAIHVAHMQRTVRAMETRMLRSSPPQASFSIHAELAHEITNVLTMMRASVEAAHDHLHATTRVTEASRTQALIEVARSCLGDATTGIEQLDGLVQRLRLGDSARTTQPDRCDAVRAIDTTLRIVRADIEKSARVTLVTDASPSVSMNHVELGQVILNLLINASQAMSTPTARGNHITIRVSKDRDTAAITVEDTGPGIPEGMFERIFDPGVTTKASGPGLGLAIVRDLVTRVGGSVTAHNSTEGGAMFTVRLPVVP